MTTQAPISFTGQSIRLQTAKDVSSTCKCQARRKADAKYPTFDMQQFQLAVLC